VTNLPSTHHVAIPAKHFGQAANNNISKPEDIDVEEIADSFVDDDEKIIFIRQSSYPTKIGRLQERISRKFAEKSKDFFAVGQSSLEIIKVFRRTVTVKDAAWTKLFEYFQCVNVWESAYLSERSSKQDVR
jgi:hypothetical protein